MMTATLYHVAPADAADRIREEGLRPSDASTDHSRLREIMRDLLDEVARDEGRDLPDRHDAVFLWPSRDAARDYAGWLEGDHVAVSVDVDAVDAPAWTTDSQTVEVLFETVQAEAHLSDRTATEAVRASAECRGLAEEVVRYARPYDSEADTRHREVWIPGSIPAEAIGKLSPV